eukprot:gene11415-biopygen13929
MQTAPDRGPVAAHFFLIICSWQLRRAAPVCWGIFPKRAVCQSVGTSYLNGFAQFPGRRLWHHSILTTIAQRMRRLCVLIQSWRQATCAQAQCWSAQAPAASTETHSAAIAGSGRGNQHWRTIVHRG